MTRLRLLGPPDIQPGGSQDAGTGTAVGATLLRQPKAIALLTYLALATPRGFHSRDTLMALLWPELDEERSRKALRQTLYEIRSALGKAAIENRGYDAVALGEEVEVDAVEFDERLKAARAGGATAEPEAVLDLYRGELLEGFWVPEASVAWEQWLDGERSRLGREARNAAEKLAAGAAAEVEAAASGTLRSDQLERVIRLSRGAVELAPLDEAPVARLLRLLALAGRSGAVIEVFDAYKARREEALGDGPSAELASRREEALVAAKTAAPLAPAQSPVSTFAPNQAKPGAESSRASAAAAETSLSTPRRRPLLAVAALVLVLALVAVGWILARGASSDPLDAGRVAVLPFRVTGAAPELNYLREGVMDLLAAQFGAEDEVRIVPPRDVMAALADRHGGAGDRASAHDVARSLGAGSVLLGQVVGTEDELVISASLAEVGGAESTRLTVRGRADSLHVLVNALATQLLASQAGSAGTALERVTTTSVPALRAYLRGTRHFRAGRHVEATRAFDEALSLDSTFAQAAVGFLQAGGWASYLQTENAPRVNRLAWRSRDRLDPGDRLFVEAMLGRNYPETTRLRDQLDDLRAATTSRPDLPAPWHLLGDLYYHHAASLGIGEPLNKAEAAFRRALELDSLYFPALSHLADIAASRRDTTALRDHTRKLAALDPANSMVQWNQFQLQALGATATDGPRLDTLAPRALAELAVKVRATGVGVHEVGRALERATRELEAPDAILWGTAFQIAARRGRARELRFLFDRGIQPPHWPTVNRISAELYIMGDTTRAGEAVAEWGRTEPSPEAQSWSPLAADCAAAQYRLWRGDTTGVRTVIADLTREAPSYSGAVANSVRACAVFLEAFRATLLDLAGADEAVEELEEFILRGEVIDLNMKPLLAYILAHLHEDRGDLERALAATGLNSVHGFYLTSPLILKRAELAERLGHREEAIEAYREYLHWNRDAQPPIDARVAEARRRLGRLTAGEPES